MTSPLPLASKNDYELINNEYWLKGKHFLLLPGTITKEPEKGAQIYNDALVEHLKNKHKRRIKLNDKFPKNHRILKIQSLIKDNFFTFDIDSLSKIERIILDNLVFGE